jgi:hypothetical protein
MTEREGLKKIYDFVDNYHRKSQNIRNGLEVDENGKKMEFDAVQKGAHAATAVIRLFVIQTIKEIGK